jgi:hypothetical protein
MAHTCNPSHSGGRDPDDCSSKPVWAISKKPFIKIGVVEWLKVKILSSSPNTTKKK